MKYNCLRINQHAKMFVVGLLLYFGETVFFKCSEEGTFIVHVKPLRGGIIDVPECKGTDKLSGFMKKFEEAYEKNYNDMDLKKHTYNLVYDGKSIVQFSKPINDKSLKDLGIGKESTLYFVLRGFDMEKGSKAPNPMVINTEEEDKVIHSTTEENAEPATSTCPLRNCCKICGC